jgi:hypothetical protein
MPPIYTPPSSNRLFNLYPPFPLSPSIHPFPFPFYLPSRSNTADTGGADTHTGGAGGAGASKVLGPPSPAEGPLGPFVRARPPGEAAAALPGGHGGAAEEGGETHSQAGVSVLKCVLICVIIYVLILTYILIHIY